MAFPIGHKFTQEHKDKIAKALIGNKNSANYKGPDHPAWKEQSTYRNTHRWMHRNFGYPLKCEHCGQIGKRVKSFWNIEWANISDTYKRERSDWLGLCKDCHNTYDLPRRSAKLKQAWHWRRMFPNYKPTPIYAD